MDEIDTVSEEPESAQDGYLVLRYADQQPIKIDARALDRVVAVDDELVVELDSCRVALKMLSGPTSIKGIVESLGSYTRANEIRSDSALQFEKRRLSSVLSNSEQRMPFVFIGSEPVLASNSVIFVGGFSVLIEDVKRYANVAASVPLPTATVQASLLLLVVADRLRMEDPRALSERIASYEATVKA